MNFLSHTNSPIVLGMRVESETTGRTGVVQELDNDLVLVCVLWDLTGEALWQGRAGLRPGREGPLWV